MPRRDKKKCARKALINPRITIIKATRMLTLMDGDKPFYRFPVAIGTSSTPTPVGNYSIASKIMNPGGVLGSRWLGLNYDSYGIHGTIRPRLIGKMVSHGCVRMHNHDVETLFPLVKLGTPVYIRDELHHLFRDQICSRAALDEELL